MNDKLDLNLVIEEAEEGGFIGYVEEIDGVNTQGETIEETKSNLMDALQLFFDARRELSSKRIGRKKVIRQRLTLL